MHSLETILPSHHLFISIPLSGSLKRCVAVGFSLHLTLCIDAPFCWSTKFDLYKREEKTCSIELYTALSWLLFLLYMYLCWVCTIWKNLTFLVSNDKVGRDLGTGKILDSEPHMLNMMIWSNYIKKMTMQTWLFA